MFKASIRNSGGETLQLTGREEEYQVFSISGLNPPKGQINLTDIAGLDGALFNSSKLTTRNIVIMIRINGDVEENRLQLYQFFRTKEACRFYYSNGSRDVYIDGYVESVESDIFSISEVVQVSIICPYPYFRAAADTVEDISDEMALFEFPFAINEGDPVPVSEFIAGRETVVTNMSESETGMIITVRFLDDMNGIVIRDVKSGAYMDLTYGFLADDLLTINTNPGQKSIALTRAGIDTNIFAALSISSTFLELAPGENVFSYSTDGDADDKVRVVMTFTRAYRGV